jgi:glycerophosphoryl diester phosphodiesterase
VILFAHRGFGPTQNSIVSLNQAYKNGFKAIEFDIWFLEKQLFLKHDRPKKSELKTLTNLGDFFAFKNEFCYWLDFKNLDEENADDALKLVREKINEAAINLNQIYFAPFITNYEIAGKIFIKIRKIFGKGVKLIAVCEELKSPEDVRILRDFLTKNEVKFLSIFHQLIDKTFVKIFSDIEIFAWTVNDLKGLKELENLGIKNFATDKITQKRYDSEA